MFDMAVSDCEANSHSSEILQPRATTRLAPDPAGLHSSQDTFTVFPVHAFCENILAQQGFAEVSEIELDGKLLIAMPGMGDPRFSNSVVFICAHSAEGAMGLIVNKRADDLRLRDLFDQLKIDTARSARDLPVHFGGPVEHGRGFVLHDYGYRSTISTLDVNDEFAMTATLDILEDLAAGRGPVRNIVALGYAGWGPGQLEDEIGQNAWLTVEADKAIVFDADDHGKWEAALAKLGVSAVTLSSDAGRA